MLRLLKTLGFKVSVGRLAVCAKTPTGQADLATAGERRKARKILQQGCKRVILCEFTAIIQTTFQLHSFSSGYFY